MSARPKWSSDREIDKAEAVLAACGGDALRALHSVIADAEYLCEQLEIASLYLSPGMSLGWKPSFSRAD